MALNWTYEGKDFTIEDIKDYYGFVYLITNLQSEKKYIGKKFFYSSKTKTVKGKKKKFKAQSDWIDYYGSNAELQNDVQKLGRELFKREIIYLCKTKGECGYLEAREQFDKKVLENGSYYNTWIMVRVRKSHIKGLINEDK
jgi:hypothetical protein